MAMAMSVALSKYIGQKSMGPIMILPLKHTVVLPCQGNSQPYFS